MKSIIKIVSASLLFLSICISCNEDLGNYTYKEINDVIIDSPAEVGVRIPKEDSVLVVIKPEITQKDERKDNSNLRYLWAREITGQGSAARWETIGTEPTCSIYVKSWDRTNIKVRLAVTDLEQDIVTYSETTIRLIAPFNRVWFVLQDEGGSPVLGCVDGENDAAVVIKDVYKEEQPQGEPLTGTPVALEVNPMHASPYFLFGMFKETVLRVLTSTGGYLIEKDDLSIRHKYDEMLLHKRNIGEAANPQHLSPGTQYNEYIIDNGIYWFAFPNGFDLYYPVKLDPALGTTYRAENASLLDLYSIVYDGQGKRFLKYLNTAWDSYYWDQQYIRGGGYSGYDINDGVNSPRLEEIGESASAPNEFNPNAIDGGEMVYMGITTNPYMQKNLALFLSGSQINAYEFDAQGFSSPNSKRCSGKFSVPLEGANHQANSYATSVYFDRMFFYSNGNKIYRVDLNRASPKAFLVYEHPDSSAKITKIKFRQQKEDTGYEDGYDWIQAEMPSYLGAAVEYGNGEYGLLDMKMAKRGDIEQKADGTLMLYEWKGFSKIIDFSYGFDI